MARARRAMVPPSPAMSTAACIDSRAAFCRAIAARQDPPTGLLGPGPGAEPTLGMREGIRDAGRSCP